MSQAIAAQPLQRVSPNTFPAQYRSLPGRTLPWMVLHQTGPNARNAVWVVRVDANHSYLVRPHGTKVALKKYSESSQDYLRELKAFEILGDHHSNHIIRPLSSIHDDDERCDYFLFPRANGDLWTYWRDNCPVRNETTVRWMKRQNLGLAWALELMRRMEVSHMDMKPQNILLFQTNQTNLPTLTITDFGSSMSRKTATNHWPQVSLTYRAPEYGDQVFDYRKYDIWGLGCIFLEGITWYLKGPNALTDFQNERIASSGDATDTFWVYQINPSGHRTPVPSPSIRNWTRLLRQDGRCTGYIHDLLYFILDSMLVTKDLRADSHRVVSALGSFH